MGTSRTPKSERFFSELLPTVPSSVLARCQPLEADHPFYQGGGIGKLWIDPQPFDPHAEVAGDAADRLGAKALAKNSKLSVREAECVAPT